MRIRTLATSISILAYVLTAAPAAAQYRVRPYGTQDLATGERYHVEVSGSLWNPTPDIVISSESLGIAGDQIDFVNDLGIEKTTFKQLNVVLRPATKHKFRFEYTPITYNAVHTVERSFVFNGQRYTIGLPVTSDLEWRAYRFGYEWDFLYKERGFVGLLLEAKYTDIKAQLSTSFAGASDTEFTRAQAPIPAIGFIARAYPAPNIAITGEFSGFKYKPDAIIENEKYGGKYWDLNIYGTVNFTDHVGAQVGYRSFDVFYKVEDDNGTMKLKGLYFGAVGRF
jgi:hypothetical protein